MTERRSQAQLIKILVSLVGASKAIQRDDERWLSADAPTERVRKSAGAAAARRRGRHGALQATVRRRSDQGDTLQW